MGRFGDVDYAAIALRNKKNTDALADNGRTTYVCVRDIVLIGAGHDPKTVIRVESALGTPNRGEIIVTKGDRKNPGQLIVTNFGTGRREFEDEIARFTKKEVVFVEKPSRRQDKRDDVDPWAAPVANSQNGSRPVVPGKDPVRRS